MANEVKTPIPARLYNAAVGGHVAGTEDIYDDTKGKTQKQINTEVEQSLGSGGSVDSRIQSAVNNEKSRAEGVESSQAERITTLENAVGSGGSVDERIATEGAKHYLKSETYTKDEVHGLITTPNQQYITVTATNQTTAVTDVLPASGEADTVYRVGNWDGSAYDDTVYSEYAWNGTAYVFLRKKDYGIDDEPTAGSENLVKSGGVFNGAMPTIVSNNGNINRLFKELYLIGTNNEVYLSVYAASSHNFIFVDSNGNAIAQGYYTGNLVCEITQNNNSGVHGYALLDIRYVETSLYLSEPILLNNTVYNIAYSPYINSYLRAKSNAAIKELSEPYDMLTANYLWNKFRVFDTTEYNTQQVASILVGNYDVIARRSGGEYSLVWAGNNFEYSGKCIQVISNSNPGVALYQHIADNGTDISNKVYKLFIELYSSLSSTAMLFKGTSDSSPNVTIINNKKGYSYAEITINGSDIQSYQTYGYNICISAFAIGSGSLLIGRCCLIDITEQDRSLPAPLVKLDKHYKNTLRFAYLSTFFNKKFYSIGDSIVYQNRWQPKLAELKALNYVEQATIDETYPLGIGGSTICPLVRVTTEDQGALNKAVDNQGNQLTDNDGNLLWFITGQAPNQSIYYRVDYFANQYNDAEVIVMLAGENDGLVASYLELGTVNDAPYEGMQYVLPQYAIIAKYYSGVAILNDGSYELDAEYLNGDYTLITTRPTFAACIAGTIKKILTILPAVRLIGCSIQRGAGALHDLPQTRTDKNTMLCEVYKEYGIPVADFWNNQGSNAWANSILYSDGTHPSALGGIRMASILANML